MTLLTWPLVYLVSDLPRMATVREVLRLFWLDSCERYVIVKRPCRVAISNTRKMNEKTSLIDIVHATSQVFGQGLHSLHNSFLFVSESVCLAWPIEVLKSVSLFLVCCVRFLPQGHQLAWDYQWHLCVILCILCDDWRHHKSPHNYRLVRLPPSFFVCFFVAGCVVIDIMMFCILSSWLNFLVVSMFTVWHQ